MFISEKSMKKKFQHYWDYIIAAIITPLIWGWYYGDHFKLSLSYPLTNQSDLWMGFASIKALINGEWSPFSGIVLNHIGSPFGAVNISMDYPILEQLQFVFIWIIGFFSSNPFLVMNIYYILGFVFVVWTMIFLTRQFHISQEIGFVVGLLYAFIPYHFFRYEHIMLASYCLIPIAGLLLFWIWSKKPLFVFNKRSPVWWAVFDRKSWFAGIAALLIGFWHVYYAFFSVSL